MLRLFESGNETIKRSTFFLGANQGIKTNSERLVSTNQHTFSNTKEAWLRICPLNSHKIKQSRTIFTDQDSWSQSQMLLQATHMWPPLPFNVICAEIVNIVGGTELPSTPMVMAHPCADHSTQCYVRLPTCRIRSESQEESFWPPWTLAPRSNSCSQCQTPSSREHPTALGLRPLQTAALPHPDPSPSIRKTQVAAETCGGVAEEARTRACTRLSTKHTYTYVRNSTWYMYIALQCNRTLQYGVQAFVD